MTHLPPSGSAAPHMFTNHVPGNVLGLLSWRLAEGLCSSWVTHPDVRRRSAVPAPGGAPGPRAGVSRLGCDLGCRPGEPCLLLRPSDHTRAGRAAEQLIFKSPRMWIGSQRVGTRRGPFCQKGGEPAPGCRQWGRASLLPRGLSTPAPLASTCLSVAWEHTSAPAHER